MALNLLFPGRHLLHTRFQEKYISEAVEGNLSFANRKRPDSQDIESIVFAITSCNQSNSRYNPISYEKRIIGVDRFAHLLKNKAPGLNHRIFGIPDFISTERFAEIMLKEIFEQSEGELALNPKNTVVLCSTPSVIEMFDRLGFGIIPAELVSLDKKEYLAETPIELVKKIAVLGENWEKSEELMEKLAPSTIKLFNDFPDITRKIFRIYNDPIITDDGSLTDTRNYDTYAFGMGKRQLITIKYSDIKDSIRPGKIVDEGCADGALLIEIARDFQDSDLIGVDLSKEFIARAEENKRAYRFGKGTFVHFHHRNVTEKIFQDDSIDTTICNSTAHELWSYGSQEKTVKDYLLKKFRQTRNNGRIIIRDVVGPESKDEIVYMLCNERDGPNENPYKEFDKGLEEHLKSISTYSKFLRFSADFLEDMRKSGRRKLDSKIRYGIEEINGKKYFRLKLKDAVEFMTKKDYADNWKSELNEEFAFWSFSEWKNELKKAGFSVIENPNDKTGSRAYSNQWIVENRFKNKVELYKMNSGKLVQADYPVTNMVLVGEKQV